MESELVTLQKIADTLETEPMASQKILAENAGMSIGLMNAVLKRFVERGWIMLTNVNLRKLSYAVTPEGISELTKRSQAFSKRTFALANIYNQKLSDLVLAAKNQGKASVILYGQSYIKFLLEYACKNIEIKFIQKSTRDLIQSDSLCLIGELNEEDEIAALVNKGGLSLLDFLKD